MNDGNLRLGVRRTGERLRVGGDLLQRDRRANPEIRGASTLGDEDLLPHERQEVEPVVHRDDAVDLRGRHRRARGGRDANVRHAVQHESRLERLVRRGRNLRVRRVRIDDLSAGAAALLQRAIDELRRPALHEREQLLEPIFCPGDVACLEQRLGDDQVRLFRLRNAIGLWIVVPRFGYFGSRKSRRGSGWKLLTELVKTPCMLFVGPFTGSNTACRMNVGFAARRACASVTASWRSPATPRPIGSARVPVRACSCSWPLRPSSASGPA